MSVTHINNAAIWDSRAEAARAGSVVVAGERIESVHFGDASPAAPSAKGAQVIDATGMTLMPGLVEGHFHPSFVGIGMPYELGLIPPERHALLTAANVKLILEHGFTAAFEAASAKPMLGVAIRDAINEGIIPGPRMTAGSPEITVTGGLGDERRRHIYQESFSLVGDGPVELRKIARECIGDGVDTIKINISGDEFVSHARAETTPMGEDELRELVTVARRFNKKIAAHARSSASVKLAVKFGIDCIYHCDFADEEALDMLESVKDKIFVGPAFGLVHNCTQDPELGLGKATCEAMGLYRKFDSTCATYHEIRKRGIRVVVGGDYGFAMTPMGQNARDIHHFVKYFGYSNAEALTCATTVGAQLMGLADQIGLVEPGYLADLLLVRGDVLSDVALLQDKSNLAMVMKGGQIHTTAD